MQVRSAIIEKLPKRMDVYSHVILISSGEVCIDHKIVDNIRTGWEVAITAMSKQDKTRIILLFAINRAARRIFNVVYYHST